jgi:adenosylmethionine-8-amino-7-oxononanoate aminotransferase
MGVWIRPLGNVIVLMPPLCISREQVDHLVAVIKAAIARALD